MRVVLVTNGLLYGGAERIVEALALDLTARGDHVHVVATTRDGPLGETLRARGVPVTVLGIKSPLDARIALKLARLAGRFRAEIIHSHLAVSDLATAIARPIAGGARIVTTVHSGYLDLGRVARAAWRSALSTFDRVLAVSEPVRALLPHALDVSIVRPSLFDEEDAPIDRAEARARLGVRDDEQVVLAIGRLVPVKGFDVLARAAARLRSPRVRVLIVGDGPEHERLARLRGLELLGAREDAGKIVAAADVVVSASRSEGFPLAPLHAMAASVPVVATRVGGTPEIVVDGETGLLVPAEDEHALAAALDRLLEDRGMRESLGAAGRARLFREGLTRRSMITKTRAIYGSALV